MTPVQVTWRSVWADTTAAVGDRTQARWICEEASGAEGEEFTDALDDVPTARMRHHVETMVERAVAGEPIQYVLGHWGFRRLDLAVDGRVLIPRPETELVAEVAIELAAHRPTRTVADLGTGSGAIGLAMADELPIDGTTVWLTDVDPDALDVARANTAGLGRAGRNVRVAQGSWLEALPVAPCFDVIVANPPYVATASADVEPVVRDWEPAGALFAGPDGLDDIRVIVADAPAHLCSGGWLVMEIGSEQGPAVASLLGAAGFEAVEIRPDLAGRARIALGRRPTEVSPTECPSSLPSAAPS